MKDFDKIIGRNAITMIYFFTSQCVPCEAMEPVLDQFERRMAGRVDIYRINTCLLYTSPSPRDCS